MLRVPFWFGKERQFSNTLKDNNISPNTIIDLAHITNLFNELSNAEQQELTSSDAKVLVDVFFSTIGVPITTSEIENLVERFSTEEHKFTSKSFCLILAQILPRERITASLRNLVDHKVLNRILQCPNGLCFYVCNNGFVWFMRNEDLIESVGSKLPAKAFVVKGATRIREISLSDTHISMVDHDGVLWKNEMGDFTRVKKVLGFPRIQCVCSFQKATLCITEDGELWNHGKFFDYVSNGRIELPLAVRKVTRSFLLLDDCSLMAIGHNTYGQLGIGFEPSVVTRYTPIPSNFKFIDVACGTDFSVFLTASGDVYSCGVKDQGVLGTTTILGGIMLQTMEGFGSSRNSRLFHVSHMKKVTSLSGIAKIESGNCYTLCIDNKSEVHIFGRFGPMIKDQYGNYNVPREVPNAKDITDIVIVDKKLMNFFRDSSGSVWLHTPNEGLSLFTDHFFTEMANNEERLQSIQKENAFIDHLDKDLNISTFLQSKHIDESTIITTEMLSDLFDNHKDQMTGSIEKEISKVFIRILFHLLRIPITQKDIDTQITQDLRFLSLCGLVKRYFPESRIASELILLATEPEILFARIQPTICDSISYYCGLEILYCVSGTGSLFYANLKVLLDHPDSDLSEVVFPEGISIHSINASPKQVFCLDKSGCVWSFTYKENQISSPEMIPNLTNIVAISSSKKHALFLTSDNCVMVLSSRFCDLGLDNKETPVIIPYIQNAVNVFCGSTTSFILCEGGAIWGCGSNSQGQLGGRTNNEKFTQFFLIARSSSIVFIQPSSDATAFLLSDGTIVFAGEANQKVRRYYHVPRILSGISDIQQVCRAPQERLPFYFIDSEGNLIRCVDTIFSKYRTVNMPPVINIITTKRTVPGIIPFLDRDNNFGLKYCSTTTLIPKVTDTLKRPIYCKPAQ